MGNRLSKQSLEHNYLKYYVCYYVWSWWIWIVSRTGLDSHANMVAVGKYANILADTGNKVDVSPFTTDYQSM